MIRLSSGGPLTGETLATLRQCIWMAWDLAPLCPEVHGEDDVVVLVHGIFASAGVFRPMRRLLQRRGGVKFASFTHAPGLGVRAIADKLAELVERLPSHARIHVVGHSLGGVVARWYVQELGGERRVTQTISLASPFGGAPAAAMFPFLVGADLHQKSELLERIRERAPRSSVPHTSIVGDADWLVFPKSSAMLGAGDVVVIEGLGHNGLLFDGEVARLVAEKVDAVKRQDARARLT